MKDTKICIICGSAELKTHKAMVAPFIAERIWGKKPFNVKLYQCKKCGIFFFNPRLEDSEIEVLYKDYRDIKYQQQRFKYEQWYTKEMNDLIGNNSIELINRKKNLSVVLKKYADVSNIQSVLDYGGDKGQFIIDELSSAEKYVYEVSGVIPMQGIKKFNNISDCKNYNYDLIMCCHVMEHVSYPREIMDNIKNLAGRDTVIYFEVPLESPFISGKIQRWKSFLKIVATNPVLLYKTARSLLNVNMPKAWMHEHVNFFTVRSMNEMLIQNGFEVIALETPEIDLGWSKTKIISCLAKKK